MLVDRVKLSLFNLFPSGLRLRKPGQQQPLQAQVQQDPRSFVEAVGRRHCGQGAPVFLCSIACRRRRCSSPRIAATTTSRRAEREESRVWQSDACFTWRLGESEECFQAGACRDGGSTPCEWPGGKEETVPRAPRASPHLTDSLLAAGGVGCTRAKDCSAAVQATRTRTSALPNVTACPW